MVSENVNNKKRSGILAAFRAIFSSDEEKINEEDKKEIEALNAESAKSIESLEKRILSDKKQSRKKLAEDLKVEKVNEVPLKESANKKDRNEKENDELVK